MFSLHDFCNFRATEFGHGRDTPYFAMYALAHKKDVINPLFYVQLRVKSLDEEIYLAEAKNAPLRMGPDEFVRYAKRINARKNVESIHLEARVPSYPGMSVSIRINDALGYRL